MLVVSASQALAGTRETGAERRVLAAVNAARTSHGLQPLRLAGALERAAREHSTDMLRRDYFAHGDFDNRMVAFQVPGRAMGENIAWGTGPAGQARTIVREWLASPEHRANLLRPGYSRIGIGVARGSFLGTGAATVVTADFAGQ